MGKKIVLVDGHSILNRAFYGLPDLTNAEGFHTNAIYGFLNILFRILEEEKPGCLTVAFDVHAPTFRHKMYAEYKGTRKPMAEELRSQVPVMKEVLRSMGVVTVEKEGYEADDVIGTIAGICEGKGYEVSIVSGDRDLLQLATGHVKVRIPKTKRTGTEIEDYYAKDVKAAYQVTPREFIDVKALMGDASDNIPGVPGIGEKTATAIISSFGSIENAYAHIEEVAPARARNSLREHYDMARMSKELATIDVHVPLEYDPDASAIGNLFTPEARDWMKKLEFKNLLQRFWDAEPQTSSMEGKFRRIQTRGEADEAFLAAGAAGRAGFWVAAEREGPFAVPEEITGIALAWGEGGDGEAPDQGESVFLEAGGELAGQDLARRLAGLLRERRAVTLGLKEQLPYLECAWEDGAWEDGAWPDGADCPDDVKIAAYLLNPLKSDYCHDDIAREHLGQMIPSKTDLLGKKSLPQAAKSAKDALAAYACGVAGASLAAMGELERKLRESGMWELYREIEMPLALVLRDMEREGVRVNAEALREYGENLDVRIRALEQEIYEDAGESFNINSPRQLGDILFGKLGIPCGKKTKTGYSTAAGVLEKLAPDYPVVSKVLEYRQLTKLMSTYVEGLSAVIRKDGRIHSTFHQTVTATGRISSADPNLQNIPIRTELGQELRKVFIPKEGCVLVDADYSQIELRVLAHMSGDENLTRAYRTAQDIHRITASRVFHVPFAEVTEQQRRDAKAVNFGIVYGISSFGLSQGLSITKKEAAEYINAYFETYPGVKKFLDFLVEEAKEKGYATTMFGRRRPVPELASGQFAKRSFGERVAMNSPIQGTAADIIKIAMIRVSAALRAEGLRSRLILQVHDELLVEAYEEEADLVEEILRREMEHAADLSVKLEIGMGRGRSWHEAH